MWSWASGYVRIVDAVSDRVGRIVMFLIFAMIGVLLWSSISKAFFLPSQWTLETAQFLMVGYYMLGGAYAIRTGFNVRMDLFYGDWPPRRKAWADAFTVFFLIFFLAVLLHGAFGSAAYSLGHFGGEPYAFFKDLTVAFLSGGPEAAGEALGRLERSPTAWRPFLWPIKLVMALGIFMMLLQAVAEFIRDVARIRGRDVR